jgi:hypothetical protein
MKLVEILARELKVWPEADSEYGQIESMSQAYAGVRQKWRKDLDDWDGAHDYVPCSRFTLSVLATDHATAIVTRADWEAERAKIQNAALELAAHQERAKLKAPKANGDGWIRHRGRSNKSPVDDGVTCTVKFRDGSEATGQVGNLRWLHNGGAVDVMRYKIHKPAEQPAPVSEEAIQVGIDAADAGKLTPIADVKARFSGEDRRLEADGWIRNDGQGCPVDQGAFVEVRHRDGCVYGGIKAGEGMATNWGISNHPEDIIWYRPDFEVYPPSYKTRQALNEAKMIRGGCEDYDPQPVSRELIAKSILHCEPYEWRDRIRELDTQRAEVESTYRRQISENTQERESLVQKLAGEGFALVEVVVQPAEDMLDCKNWKRGDKVACLSDFDDEFTSGALYQLRADVENGHVKVVMDDLGKENGWGARSFKWHSRPSA